MGRDDYLDHDSGDRDYSVEGGVMRLYTLYQVARLSNANVEPARKRYFPASDIKLPKQIAIRFFQNKLLEGGYEIRPAK